MKQIKSEQYIFVQNEKFPLIIHLSENLWNKLWKWRSIIVQNIIILCLEIFLNKTENNDITL